MGSTGEIAQEQFILITVSGWNSGHCFHILAVAYMAALMYMYNRWELVCFICNTCPSYRSVLELMRFFLYSQSLSPFGVECSPYLSPALHHPLHSSHTWRVSYWQPGNSYHLGGLWSKCHILNAWTLRKPELQILVATLMKKLNGVSCTLLVSGVEKGWS